MGSAVKPKENGQLSLHVVCCGDQCKYSLTVLSNAALVSPTQGRGQAAWEWSGDLG